MLLKSQDARGGAAQIVIPAGPRLGSLVVEAEDLGKAYGDQLLFEHMEFKLPPGALSASSALTAPARRRCSVS